MYSHASHVLHVDSHVRMVAVSTVMQGVGV